jgi:hypothetical protein
MCCVAGNEIIINASMQIITAHINILRNFVFDFFFDGICFFSCVCYIVSKLVINIPAPAIIINGGAIIDNIGGNAPVAPNALNIFIKKYNAKHVTIPRLNFIPKL